MGGAPKETTTKVEPWDGAKPYLTDVYQQYNDLIKSGAPKPYAGNTVADLSGATKQSQAQTAAYAGNTGNAAGLNAAANATKNITAGNFDQSGNSALKGLLGGVNTGTNPALAGVGGLAQGGQTAPGQATLNAGMGFTNAATGLQTQQAQGLAGANNPALANLQATASGANIGKNPYLDQAVGNATQKIADQLGNVTNPTIAGGAAGMGRLGSNASASLLNNAQGAAAEQMSKVATDMYANQFNTDVQAQQNAANMYGNFYNSDVANRLNANSALAGTSNSQQSQRTDAANAGNSQYNANRDAQLAALGLQNNMYQQGVQNQFTNAGMKADAANSLNGNQNAQAGLQLSGAGMAGDQYMNGLLPSQVLGGLGQTQDTRNQDILNNQIARWDQQQQQPLTNLGNFTNILNGGGYSNTTTPVYSNTGGQILGGLTSLLGLFSSDRRIKHVLAHTGFDRGVPIYLWTYKDDPEQRVFEGPMAQDVEEVMPEAVVEFGGIKRIVMDRYMEAA